MLTVSPLTFSNGSRIVYDNLTISFSVEDASGVVGTPVVTIPPKLITSGFVPGG